MATIKEQLRANFPKTFDKTADIFCALVANDKGDAAIEAELTDVKTYMDEWTDTANIYDQTGDLLNQSVKFFTYIEKFTDETEISLKNRVKAIFNRGNYKVWGTPYNLKKVFEQYFKSATIYIVENTNSTENDNLLQDGDFADTENEYWTLINCNYSKAARFSKTYGVNLTSSNSKLSQKINFNNESNKTYFLHFFMKGDLSLFIKNNMNQYWNDKNKCWQDIEIENNFSSNEWNNKNLWFLLDSSITDVTITFSGNTQSYIDYIRLFEKYAYSSFSIVVQIEGSVAGKALALADKNPESQEKFNNYRYFDHVFMTGVSAGFAMDIYNDLLNYLKAAGTKGYIEIVNKDYIEENLNG